MNGPQATVRAGRVWARPPQHLNLRRVPGQARLPAGHGLEHGREGEAQRAGHGGRRQSEVRAGEFADGRPGGGDWLPAPR